MGKVVDRCKIIIKQHNLVDSEALNVLLKDRRS